jgi:hypothetical protein
MGLCYLTNPIVVLFADDEGELPAFLKLWQTWDSALDNRQYVLYDCPKWLSYDFDEYYDTAVMTIGHGRSKKIVIAKNPFPKRLWLKHYLNRVFWLYRNTGYGFAFYLFGVDTKPETIRRSRLHWIMCLSFGSARHFRIGKHWFPLLSPTGCIMKLPITAIRKKYTLTHTRSLRIGRLINFRID